MVSTGGAIAIALYAMALASILRDPSTGLVAKLAWAFVAFILPIIGPILWFAVGKRYPYGPSGGNR
ncbi:PLD nuclease N-terminal domain-containing protein [Rhodococcus ruber]|uniref:PLD nuclease N-terminal domain-containing protein n=1 Tax=Rhodococcus ruber TaxID=1830 RepID=A0ABT4M844_9NOCA|nr:PLD nuclease N-terminal domain-containing protein [Rhodococcus ruber]MCZ4517107.1 PLD nuclease N-terminal domain-containing protein [Rhodococcus ruber]